MIITHEHVGLECEFVEYMIPDTTSRKVIGRYKIESVDEELGFFRDSIGYLHPVDVSDSDDTTATNWEIV